jgi:hypothetical protein
MSYDLMVFEPTAAPRERNAFLDWYRAQTQWTEDHSYNDPSVTTTRLSAWFADMRRDFPSVNDASDGADNPRVTEYSIGKSVIYAAFRWSEAESAYAAVRTRAVGHRLGFFNVSADNGEIWFPPAEHAPDTTAISSLKLTLEGQSLLEAPSIALIEAAVDWLNPSGGPGFLALDHQNGNYTQVGGGKDACTLEWREYSGSGFHHWVAGLRTQGSSPIITIPGNGTHFSVQANEKLSNDHVKSILIAFARTNVRPDDFVWRDISSKFRTD